MYVFVTILIIIICILLALMVLIQNPKGGGVNATFGGASQQIFGASRTTDVVEKTTWTLAILLLTFSVCSAVFIPKNSAVGAKGGNPKVQQKTTSAPVEVTDVEKRLKETGQDKVPTMPQQQQQPNNQQAPAQQPK
jgi:preprotein translocase subunit SecG